MKSAFIVDDERKRYCLMVAGKLHRGFRTLLTRKYLKDVAGNFILKRPKLYEDLISKEEWAAFVAKRQTENFQKVSKMNRQRALNPAYPHRISRMGYPRLEQKILKETKSDQTSLEPHVLWKAARVKDGVIDENVQKVFEECEKLSQSLSQEDSSDITCRDVLSKVLNVPEYSGRVRAKGYAVTPTNYYEVKEKEIKPTNAHLLKLIQNLSGQLQNLTKTGNIEKGSQNDMHVPSDKDSSNIQASKKLPEGISPCFLNLLSPTRTVAKGKVHNIPGAVLHNKSIPTGYVKVCIDIALELDASLPIPDDVADINLVGEAVGSYVAWPLNQISLNSETPAKSKVDGDHEIKWLNESVTSKKRINQTPKLQVKQSKKARPNNVSATIPKGDLANGFAPLSRYMQCLKTMAEMTMVGRENNRDIPMEEDIFGVGYTERIGKEQMNELFLHQELGVSVICIYIRYLYEKLVCPRQLKSKFSFLSPHRLSSIVKSDRAGLKDYLVQVFSNNKDATDKLFLAPYNYGFHWVLIVINATKEIVYYLDPLHGDNKDNIKQLKETIDTAIQVFRTIRGGQVPKNKSNNITWNQIQCPRQTNGIDCGYFVLRFMKEIVTSNQNVIPKQYFEEFRSLTYSKEKLTEIKEDWCEYMLQLRVI